MMSLIKTTLMLLLLQAGASHAADLLQPCRVDGFEQQVQCGQLLRPLNPAEAGGKQITIHFIILPAQDKAKVAEPVFLLAGGPGQSAINVARWMQVLFEKLQRRHDLVFIDQRGTGKSFALNCVEENDLNAIGDAEYAVRAARKCQAELEKLIDLRWFTTSLAMQDLDAVRAALAYNKINLIGVSYGTRAALEYERQFPAHVQRMVLDGVVQPEQMFTGGDMQQALTQLFSDCARDERCRQAYPTLPQDWKKLLASLPRTTQLTHPRLGYSQSAKVGREDVLGWVAQVLYSPVNSAALPRAIMQALQNNFNPLLALSGAGNLPNPGSIAYGMHFSVVCAEEYPPRGQPVVDDFSVLQTSLYANVCAHWPHGPVAPEFYHVPVSQSAVLLLSGGIDPVTPPYHAQQVARELGTRVRQIVLEHSGHGMLQQACLADVATNFIDANTDQQALDVDASCVRQIPRPSAWIAPLLPTGRQP